MLELQRYPEGTHDKEDCVVNDEDWEGVPVVVYGSVHLELEPERLSHPEEGIGSYGDHDGKVWGSVSKGNESGRDGVLIGGMGTQGCCPMERGAGLGRDRRGVGAKEREEEVGL